MSRTSYLILAILFPISVFAQEFLHLPLSQQKAVPLIKARESRNTNFQRDAPSVPLEANFLNQESVLGITYYDIQTNAASQNRIVAETDGYKAGVWMLSQTFDQTYPDRGTGFSEFVNGSWSPRPTTRLESVRTGWPCLVRLADGTLHITAHTGGQNLLALRREPGASTWSESMLPNNTPEGLLWPRTAAGGPDGMTIHLLALTTPADGLGGGEYLGMNGHPLYYRSLDGGITWDKQDVVIPGLDSTSYYEVEGDTYSIAARDNIVAVAVFGMWGDVSLYKSYDNGDSWERTIVNDFPLDKYKVDQGYTVDDIPFDLLAPDTLAIYTSDGSGGIAIDGDGLVHLTYADSYVMDNDLTDSTTSLFPGTAGISYWNETMELSALVGSFLDYNDNDTIDLTFEAIPRYGNGSATSMPVIAADDKGGVYIIYSAVAEAYYNELDEQNYRHLLAVKSVDGGQTWGPAYDIINPEFSDPEAYEFFETVFPSMASLVNDTLHILYQQDFFPGYSSIDVNDMQADNFIVYTGIPVGAIPDATSVAVHDLSLLDFSVYPNPMVDFLNIELNEQVGNSAILELFNAQGQRLIQQKVRDSKLQLNVNHLNPGIYFVKVASQAKIGFRSVVKSH
ncbi:MAG: T9SS type A sorting domain-containing protein, partial [Saprospiraceae bacterium]|nr:T9SS type A sorting domain-containing protein [Saprospiraceae bacterium]